MKALEKAKKVEDQQQVFGTGFSVVVAQAASTDKIFSINEKGGH